MFRVHDAADKPVEAWAKQYRSGMSLIEIAKPAACSISTVRRCLLAAGVQLRTHEETYALAGPKIGAKHKGKKRGPFSLEWRQNLSRAKLAAPAAGIRFTSQGYIEYTRGPHKGRSLHVVAMETLIGRRLQRGEVVHHIDGDKCNNDLSNLQLMTNSAHMSLHRRLR